MEQITVGNVLTIASVVLGLILQYNAIMRHLSERMTRLEAEQIVKHSHIDESIKTLVRDVRVISAKVAKDGTHEQPYN